MSVKGTSAIHRRRLFQSVGNVALACIAFFFAFALRFELALPAEVRHLLVQGLLLVAVIKGVIFQFRGLHRRLRRFASIADVLPIVTTNAVASAVFAACVLVFIGPNFPRSVLLMDFILCTTALAMAHYSERVYREGWKRHGGSTKNILVYGAGRAGSALIRETDLNAGLALRTVGFLDDDPKKHGSAIHGVPVLGYGRDAATIVDLLRKRGVDVYAVVIAMPSASGQQIREALANCRQARVECKIIPGTREMLDNKTRAPQIRNLQLEDLLGRKPVRLDEGPIRSSIEGVTVLVTGAAGSIGSELCRQVARFGPKRLMLFDQAETPLFHIHSELTAAHPELDIVPILGDLCNTQDLAAVFESTPVDSVYHAAAYKHVPMLERCIIGGVRNNVIGTYNLITAAKKHSVSRFVMISTDKAVNPTNIMGATKRACELIVLAVAGTVPGMRSATVRFGNVLGSNGSVVPIFQSQIAAGGPLTITDPEIRRFFMMIPEAVSLVLQTSTMSDGAEVFVLNMGEPIRILDLAINMIRLAGLEPYEDIDIQITGLRPGEKLTEELCAHDEMVRPTFHEKITVFRQPKQDPARVDTWVRQAAALVAEGRKTELVAHLRELVPEYTPDPRLVSKIRPHIAATVGGSSRLRTTA